MVSHSETSETTGRGRRLLRFIALLLVGLGLLAAALAFVRSRDWSAAEDLDNYQELNIVGRSMESWPVSVGSIAKANLLRDRLEAPPNALERDLGGWMAAARLEHPDVGTIQVLYRLEDKNALTAKPQQAGAPALASAKDCGASGAGSVSIDPSNSALKMEGGVPLAELWQADNELSYASSEIETPNGDSYSRLVKAMDPAELFGADPSISGCPSFRYQASISLKKIANIETNAPAFSNILLIDPAGNFVASLGDTTLPITGLKDIVPTAAEYRELVTQLLMAASRAKADDPKGAETRARQAAFQAQRAAKPLDVDVAGQSYVAYFRPIKFTGSWNAPGCQPSQNTAKSETASGDTSQGGTLDAPGTSCLLIGLVPQREHRARLIPLAPDLLTLFTLMLAFALVLVPVTKLRFLGPAGDMSRLEVGVMVFGLVAAVAIVTLAALAMHSALRLHAQSRTALEDVAETMAGHFDEELRAAIAQPFWLPPEKNRDGIPIASPAIYDNIDCRFADNTRIDVNDVAANSDDPPFWIVPHASRPDPADASTYFAWPKRDLVMAFGEQGRAFPHFSPLAYRCHAGGRPKIDTREYFQRAMRNETDGTLPTGTCTDISGLGIDERYTIGAVRAQLDGLAKVVLVNRFWKDRAGTVKGCKEPVKPASDQGGPRHGVMLQALVMRSLLAPVIPRGMRYIVIDTSDHQLPYLFGTDSQQIGVYSLAETLTDSGARKAIDAVSYRSRHADGKAAGLDHFTAQFEGMQRNFVAKGLPGTPWVLLVHQPVSDIDARLARTVGWAAGLWWGFAILAALMVLGLTAIGGRRIWLWLWPRPGNAKTMTQAGNAILVICALALLSLLAGFDGVVAVALITLGVPFISVAVAWIWIAGRTPMPEDNEAAADIRNSWAKAIADWFSHAATSTARIWRRAELPVQEVKPATDTDASRRTALLPSDERGFARLGIALLLALGAVPMCAAWADSRADERAARATDEIEHLEQAWKANRQALSAIIRSYGLTNATAVPVSKMLTPGKDKGEDEDPARGRPWTGLYGFKVRADVQPVSLESSTTTTLRDWMGTGRGGAVRGCTADGTPPPHGFCIDADGSVGLFEDQRSWIGAVWWPGAMGSLLTLIGLTALLWSSCRGMTRALFGFGIPLEAVTYPGIERKIGPRDENGTTERKPLLPDRAVVLNGPLALTIDLLGDADPLDLAQADGRDGPYDALLAKQLQRLDAHQTVVVTNLDIALKDSTLRRRALASLEVLSDRAEKRWHTVNKEEALGTRGHLVVMTDLSPLDRVLQAYERELDKSQESDPSSRAGISRTEQLRWSRLFEDFTTYTLPVQAKFLWSREKKEKLKQDLGDTDPHQIDGIVELIREVRFLPETVIHSLIDPEDIPERSHWTKMDIKSYPLQPKDYEKIYYSAVRKWAVLVKPATRPAAIDYLRGVLIEHYQHLWAASSHAERVILDNLARGRVFNIEAALAIRSLIRRGLVVLDPAPRIVNQSFAAFVCQAEKPEALRDWRKEQPQGGWDKIARPLSFLLPGAIVLLAAMAIIAGESLMTVLPIVIGAGPALLSTLISSRKPA